MSPRTIRPRADRARESWSRLLPPAALVVALAHAVVLFFVALPPGESVATIRGDDLLVELLEEPIPPPPEERARPAEPVVAEEPVDESITVAPTEIVENPPPVGGPPGIEPSGPTAGETYGFVPHTVRPRCVEGCSTDAILARLPAPARRAGLGCEVVIGIRVDTSGAVTATQVLSSSGNAACEAATAAWARGTRWSTAYNRDQPVAVWIAQPVSIRSE